MPSGFPCRLVPRYLRWCALNPAAAGRRAVWWEYARADGIGTGPALAVGLAVAGIVCIAASLLIAYLIADHSSSDSSPSSLTAIGLGGLGFLLVLVSVLLVIASGLERLWRRVRTPSGGTPGRN